MKFKVTSPFWIDGRVAEIGDTVDLNDGTLISQLIATERIQLPANMRGLQEVKLAEWLPAKRPSR